MKSLKVLAEVTKTTVTDIMEPHKELVQDMVPPKKLLLRHIALVSQIGIMVSWPCHLLILLSCKKYSEGISPQHYTSSHTSLLPNVYFAKCVPCFFFTDDPKKNHPPDLRANTDSLHNLFFIIDLVENFWGLNQKVLGLGPWQRRILSLCYSKGPLKWLVFFNAPSGVERGKMVGSSVKPPRAHLVDCVAIWKLLSKILSENCVALQQNYNH